MRQLARRHPMVERTARRMLSLIPVSRRLGPGFARWYSLFLESEQWPEAQVMALQRKLLVDLLGTVSRTSSYYRELLDGLSPDHVAADPSLYLPIMTRSAFRHRYDQIRDHAFTEPLTEASTSGTSGNPLQFCHARSDNAREWAAICHQWRRVGYDPLRSRRAELRGLVQGRGIVQPYPDGNMVRFSVLHLLTEHVRHYAEVCTREGIAFLHGYPSAVNLLARQCLSAGIRFPTLRGIMLASEMVYPHQVDTIAAAFPLASITAHYGNAERVALGAWCEHDRSCHFLPLYSLVEIDPRDGALIGTNLFNTINPFIRYRMNDHIGAASHRFCPSCGRLATPLATSIQGRAEDYLFSPQRGWIPPAIVTYPLKSLRFINEIQFFQEEPDRIELRYTCVDGPEALNEVKQLSGAFGPILGDMTIVPIRVDHLERSASGKLKWIVSLLDPPGQQPASP